MTRKKFRLGLFTVALAGFILGAAPSTQPGKSAMEAAKDYTQQMKAAKPEKALEYWDMNSIIDSVFPQDLNRISAEDRKTIDASLKKFLTGIYANKEIVDAMARCKFEDFAEKPSENGILIITFKNVFPDGKSSPNTLFFKQVENQWRVVDIQTGQQPLCATLRDSYLKVRKDITPWEFIEIIVSSTKKETPAK